MDIWCIGVTLYVMLEAALPFEGETDLKRKRNIMELKWHQPQFSSPEALSFY